MRTIRSPSETNEFARGWPVVVAAAFGAGLGLSPLSFYTSGIFAPFLARAFHWSYSSVLAGSLVLSVTIILVSPLIGVLVERSGVRKVALISLPIFGLAFMGFGALTGSKAAYYATWFLVAAAGTGTLPLTWTTAVNSWFFRRRGLALGLSLVTTGLFGALVKPLTNWLIETWNWRIAYFGIGLLPILVAWPIAIVALRERPIPVVPVSDDASSQFSVSRNFRFWLIAAVFLQISFAIAGPIPNLENHLALSGFSHHDIVRLAATVGLGVVAGRLIGGWLLDRLWAPLVGGGLLLLSAAGCCVLTTKTLSYDLAIASIALLGIAAGLEYDLLAYLVARYFEPRRYGRVYGLLFSVYSLGSGAAPAAFGWIYDRYGSYEGALYGSAGLLTSGAILLLGLGRYLF